MRRVPVEDYFEFRYRAAILKPSTERLLFSFQSHFYKTFLMVSPYFWYQGTGSAEDTLVVLQDYPSAEISEPIYRMGEKLRLVAQ